VTALVVLFGLFALGFLVAWALECDAHEKTKDGRDRLKEAVSGLKLVNLASFYGKRVEATPLGQVLYTDRLSRYPAELLKPGYHDTDTVAPRVYCPATKTTCYRPCVGSVCLALTPDPTRARPLPVAGVTPPVASVTHGYGRPVTRGHSSAELRLSVPPTVETKTGTDPALPLTEPSKAPDEKSREEKTEGSRKTKPETTQTETTDTQPALDFVR
jgi:hypothetical protein